MYNGEKITMPKHWGGKVNAIKCLRLFPRPPNPSSLCYFYVVP